jgi:hypothetical protein
MASTNIEPGPYPNRDYRDLLRLLEEKNLNSVYREFMQLTNAPPDLKCLLLVAANLHCTFKQLRAWRTIGPFRGWPLLMRFLCTHAQKIQKQFGSIVSPPPFAMVADFGTTGGICLVFHRRAQGKIQYGVFIASAKHRGTCPMAESRRRCGLRRRPSVQGSTRDDDVR